MKYERKRVMRVPIKDQDNALKQMLLDHKNGTNNALRFYRKRIRIIASVKDKDRQHKMKKKVCCLIEAKIKRDYPTLPRGSVNLTTQNSVGKPIQEFLKREGNRKRPPRYRRMDLRLRQSHCCVDLNASNPIIEIGFQNIGRQGVTMREFQLQGSQRYFDLFKEREHTVTYLNFKEGRIWANMVFSDIVVCKEPQAFIGLDAGMYSNKDAWVANILDTAGNTANYPVHIKADEDPKQAAQAIIKLAKEHNAAIVIENLKSLNRSRSGNRWGIPTAKYMTSLEEACVNNAIAFYRVDPRDTSRLHSVCNEPLYRPKDDRGWKYAWCPHCQIEVEADEDAAISIAKKQIESN